MIRRGFWLTAGAVTGIYGYRRVAAAGRRLSATLAPGHLAPERKLEGTLEGTLELARAGARARVTGRRARRGAVALARESYRFTRDVREGMELYRLAHLAPAGSTLSADRADRTRPADQDQNQDRPTDHEPEDGH
jgi:hypothetical protein